VTPTLRRPPSRRRRFALATAFPLLAALWAVGQFAREDVWLTSILFLIPSPLVVCGGIASTVLCQRSGLRQMRWVMATLTLAPLLAVLWAENHWSRPPQAPLASTERPGAWTVIHWNVARGMLGWSGVQDVLRGQNADLCLLSEPPPRESLSDAARRLSPDLVAVELPLMGVIGRGHITTNAVRRFDSGVACLLLWSWRGQQLRVLAVDLPAGQQRSRRPLLEWVEQQIALDDPDVVLGDFNALRRSRVLSTLPAGYRHGYDVAGYGWSYTWPMLCPLWAIDQAIIGPRVHPLRYELITTIHSDHRLQRIELVP
jgi:endonuclease/exonuclease/phosphatase (EEP) superfamily protein YafD